MATRRQNKYPDTATFVYHNQNPHNRITTDCVVRAFSFALNVPYNEIVMQMAEFQCKTGFEAADKEEKFLEKYYGLVRQKMLRHYDNTKYTVKEFIEEHPRGTYILRMPSHMTVIKNGKCYDIWDCSKVKQKVGNYWIVK